eukprot:5871906-Pyramimonas_sp.AAC.1
MNGGVHLAASWVTESAKGRIQGHAVALSESDLFRIGPPTGGPPPRQLRWGVPLAGGERLRGEAQ